MERALKEGFGNPSSQHGSGRAARAAIEESRERIAARLGALPPELVFTSGGTEANRLAVLGALRGAGRSLRGAHAVASAIEHPSTLGLYQDLAAEEGLEVTWVRPDAGGRVDPAQVLEALRPETVVVSLLHASNETGVVQEVRAVAQGCRARGVAFHSDAVQSLGKLPLDLAHLGADLVSLSAHKVGGPPGVGALFVRQGACFRAPRAGASHGPQERGHRPGTENLPGIIGFGRAVDLLAPPGPELRNRLWRGLRETIPEALLNGEESFLLPGTLNVSFPGVPAELLLIRLDLEGVEASSGSACSSGARRPSHVLQAMGLPPERVESAVRFSLGWTTTSEEVDRAVEVIARAVASLWRAAPGGLPAFRGAPRTAT